MLTVASNRIVLSELGSSLLVLHCVFLPNVCACLLSSLTARVSCPVGAMAHTIKPTSALLLNIYVSPQCCGLVALLRYQILQAAEEWDRGRATAGGLTEISRITARWSEGLPQQYINRKCIQCRVVINSFILTVSETKACWFLFVNTNVAYMFTCRWYFLLKQSVVCVKCVRQ